MDAILSGIVVGVFTLTASWLTLYLRGSQENKREKEAFIRSRAEKRIEDQKVLYLETLLYFHTTILEHTLSPVGRRTSPFESPSNKLELLASKEVCQSAKDLERNILVFPQSEKLPVEVLLEFSRFSEQLKEDLIAQELKLLGDNNP